MKTILFRRAATALFSLSLISVLLVSPFSAHAAYDDVTLETSAILDVGGYELTVYSTSALLEQIVVDASDFSVTMLASSVIIVESADGVAFTHDAGDGFVTSEYCSGGVSRLGLAGAAGTVTITPSGTCTEEVVVEEEETGGSTGSSQRRSSGGGGGSSAPTPTPVTPVVVAPAVGTNPILLQLRPLVIELLALGGSVSDSVLALLGIPKDGTTTTSTSVYARDLDIGATGDDVYALQQFLVAQNKGPAAAALSANGLTHLFGPLTQAALAEFQASVGLTPAVGYFGSKTRAYIAGLGL